MISADIENAVSAEEIEILPIIHVVEISALGAGIHFIESNDSLGRHQRAVQVLFMKLIILAQPRRDDFLQVESHAGMVPDFGTERNRPCAAVALWQRPLSKCLPATGYASTKEKPQDS